MSKKELDRYHILKKVLAREWTQKKAAELLKLSDRQVRNLLEHLSLYGPQGLISKKRGAPSNRKFKPDFKQTVLSLVQQKYEDFGPTLTQEKLAECHGVQLSVETLRQWMIGAHLWTPRRENKKKHLPRQRREAFGELIQADGSHHRWFGEDLDPVNATVMVDDATSQITSLYFSEGETLAGYYEALETHLKRYGRPLALYTDRYSVFQANNKTGETHMQKSLQELGIDLILANSPQAKGRVERANRTLQDRLIKEMRLRGIKTIEEANRFAPEFIETYNDKFSKRPTSAVDAHRPLEGYDLDRLLCRKEARTLLSDCIFQFNNKFYKVQEMNSVRRMKGRKVEVRITKTGKMRVFMEDKELIVSILEEVEEGPEIATRKEILARKPHKVPLEHPWKKYGHQMPRESALKREIRRYG